MSQKSSLIQTPKSVSQVLTGDNGLLAAGFAAAVAHLYGIRRVGVVFGRLMTAWGTAGLLAPVVAGHVLDRTGSYEAAALLAGACALATAGLSLAIPSKAALARSAE